MITRNLPQCPTALALFTQSACAEEADTNPNIVIIWGDDIGQSNVIA
jgi:hypothetical protein